MTLPSAPARAPARAVWLGRRRYDPIHDLQRALLDARRAGSIGDTILLLEHAPVITLGLAADPTNVLLSKEALAARGVDLVETARGGDVTFHGPGQLVGYPILDLSPDHRDVRKYVHALEALMGLFARDHGVEVGALSGKTGVWVDRAAPATWPGEAWAREPAKIGAIGVKISRWITMHGFAFNLTTDLDAFALIVPCGIRDYGVTSIAEVTGARPAVRDVALASAPHLAEALPVSVARVDDLDGEEDLAAALGLRT